MKWNIPSWLRFTTVLDRIIIILCGIASVASLFIPLTAESGNHIRIEINRKLRYQGSLFEEKLIELHGEWGDVTVETGPRGVRVRQSTCPNQVCVRQGWQKNNNAVIVCVPNRLVILIESEHKQQLGPLDTTTR
jgi:hypothetical protein